MKKNFLFLLLILIVFNSCSRQEESEPAEKPLITLSVCLKKPYFSSFFPPALQYVNDSHLYELIYNTLISANYSGRLLPEIAKCWTISPDMKEYTFILRKNVKFHNGKRLTVDDVIFTYKQLIIHAHEQYAELSYIEGIDDFIAGKTETIRGLEKIDSFTFKIKLRQKFKYFLHFLSSKVTSVIPADFGGASKSEFLEHPIGSGPFKFQSKQPEINTFKFTKNKDYFANTGNVDEVILCLPKKETELETLLTFDLFVKDITMTHGQKDFLADRTIINTPRDLETFVAINPKENPSLQHRENRQLINYSINRERLVDVLHSRNYIPAHSIIPVNLFGHNPYYRIHYLQTKKMEELLKKNPITFTLLINHGQRKVAEFLREDLKKINVNLEIIAVDARTYSKKISKPVKLNYSFIVNGSADYPSPYNFLNQLYGSDGTLNYFEVNSPQVTDLISTLPTTDIKGEINTLSLINKSIEEESLYIPLYYYANVIVMKGNIKKVLFKYPSIINFSSIEVETRRKTR